jgi:hypothetical protein
MYVLFNLHMPIFFFCVKIVNIEALILTINTSIIQHLLFSCEFNISYKSNLSRILSYLLGEDKSIPVIGREGPYCCETSRLPYFL